jgi:hypothetical protein
MARLLGIAESRAKTIAQTEIIRVHAEGQIEAFKALGVQRLGVDVEFSTSRDNAVCQECEGMEGEEYGIDEASGVIPVHIG